MNQTNDKTRWVWIIIQEPGGTEQVLGQYDEKDKISFIPFFPEKDAGLQCLNFFSRDRNKKYEVQAILFDELSRYAAAEKYMLYALNEAGEIKEKTTPAP